MRQEWWGSSHGIKVSVLQEVMNVDVTAMVRQAKSAVFMALGKGTTSDRQALAKRIKLALMPQNKAEESVVYDAVHTEDRKHGGQRSWEYFEHE